jgi:hypothetical protein
MTAFDDLRETKSHRPASEAGPPETGWGYGAHGGQDSIDRLGCQDHVNVPSPGIRLIAIKLEISRQSAAETSQPPQQFLPIGFLRDLDRPGACDTDFDVVAHFQIENFDNSRGQPDGETVTPFANLHGVAPNRWFQNTPKADVKSPVS